MTGKEDDSDMLQKKLEPDLDVLQKENELLRRQLQKQQSHVPNRETETAQLQVDCSRLQSNAEASQVSHETC
jgi:multidrug resistance efflux pump